MPYLPLGRLVSCGVTLHAGRLLRRAHLSLHLSFECQGLLRRLTRTESLRVHALIGVTADGNLPALELIVTIDDAVETAMH